MTYEQAKALLKEKGQEQLLRFYDDLDEGGKARLLAGIGKIDWSFADVLAHPEDPERTGEQGRAHRGYAAARNRTAADGV